MILDAKLSEEYRNLFDTLEIQPGWKDDVEKDIATIMRNKPRYESLVANFNEIHNCDVPWFMAGIIHKKECSFHFTQHLHNGDDLGARTIHVPVGRPVLGNPPFAWEFSALDALEHDGCNKIQFLDEIPCLYFFEKYNGFGYRGIGKNTTPPYRSPYLWAGSQHWLKGKFTEDRVFSPEAHSKNLGAGVLLKALVSRDFITFKKVTKVQKTDVALNMNIAPHAEII